MTIEGDIWEQVESLRGKYLESDEEKNTYFEFLVTEMRRPHGKSTRYHCCKICFQFATKSNIGAGKVHTCQNSYTLADLIGRDNSNPLKAKDYFEEHFLLANLNQLQRLGLA